MRIMMTSHDLHRMRYSSSMRKFEMIAIPLYAIIKELLETKSTILIDCCNFGNTQYG